MTPFAAEILTDYFMPTFEDKRKIYHKAGFQNNQYKFLQMSFIEDNYDELNACCGISTNIKSLSYTNCWGFFMKKK